MYIARSHRIGLAAVTVVANERWLSSGIWLVQTVYRALPASA